jgi:uncharacterized integral membrane protein
MSPKFKLSLPITIFHAFLTLNLFFSKNYMIQKYINQESISFSLFFSLWLLTLCLLFLLFFLSSLLLGFILGWLLFLLLLLLLVWNEVNSDVWYQNLRNSQTCLSLVILQNATQSSLCGTKCSIKHVNISLFFFLQ